MNIRNVTITFLWQFLNRHVFSHSGFFCFLFFDCKYAVFKNIASSFQDKEEIRNIKVERSIYCKRGGTCGSLG